MQRYKLLMVDDDLKNIKANKTFLEMKGFEVHTAQSSKDVLKLVKEDEYALVLMDYHMPEIMGDSLTLMIHEVNPHQQVAMFSCDLSREAVKQSLRAGVVDFIEKSSNPSEMLSRIQLFCNRYELLSRTIRPTNDRNANKELLASIGTVGQSEIMAQVAQDTLRYAEASDVSVLIRGESGTGKELVAKALHQFSSRSRGPFVAVNCAAIPKELLESELFGYKKGSFTGAINDKDGKFTVANGGTIFLDEIGDLPLELQAKLLRVIQERTVEPIGSRLPKKIDVRIITATHKDIDEMVANGSFREDLMYRIKVVEIELPPLRERPADIEPLVAHFSEVFNRKYNCRKHFQRRTLDVLRAYPWPGNVRELAATIEKHMIECEGTIIGPEDLDLRLYNTESPTSAKIADLHDFEDRQRRAKLDFIQHTINACGSKVAAARKLGIKPNHLQYLLTGSKAARGKVGLKHVAQ